MNYQLLIGKEVTLGDSLIKVESIEKFKDMDYTTKYRINNGPVFKQFDVGVAVSVIEAQIKEQNKPKGFINWFKNKFGFFFTKSVINPEIVSATVRDAIFQLTWGFRYFGFKTVGFFHHIRFGKTTYEFELCWNNKEEYEKGDLPDPFVDYKKIF